MSWISKILKSKNSVKSVSKFETDKSSVIVLASGEYDLEQLEKFSNLLKNWNVFVLSDFSNWQKDVNLILNKSKGGVLDVICFGYSSILGLKIVSILEEKEVKSKLILLDSTTELDSNFTTDKTSVERTKTTFNYTILKDLVIEKINTPIYIFYAIGGVKISEENFRTYTSGDVFYFPINGHHFEILRDVHINDVVFFVSNVLKGRHNLLSFTLTTQSATPNWYIDEDGRPMGEGKAPESCKKDVPFDMKRCPYSGTRKNHENLMNVSALKQMRSSWEESLNLIRYIRDLYLERNPRKQLELVDVWKITMYASYLPTFMLYRKEARFLNHCVPPVVAAVYKMFIGLKTPVERMIQEEFLGENDFKNLSPKIIHDYAEKNGSFIGPDEVCGGPENLVVEFLNAFMDLSIPVKENDLFYALIPDKTNLHHFVSAIINVQIFQNIHFQQTQFLVKRYLKFLENEALSKKLKEAFYIDENSIEIEKHIEIVKELQSRLELKNKFGFVEPDTTILTSASDVEKLNEELNQLFFENLKQNENLLLDGVGYQNNVLVDSDIYEQYMGLSPFEVYYKNID